MCCSVLQSLAVCYNILQRVAAWCSVLQCVAKRPVCVAPVAASQLQEVSSFGGPVYELCCSVLQRVAAC